MLVALAALGSDLSVCAGLEASRGTALRQAGDALAALDAAARARILADWHRQATNAVSAGLAGLHPSWIDEALAGERPQTSAAVRDALRDGTRDARGLARLALGDCVALADSQGGPLAEALCALPVDELLDQITRRGAQEVGRSLSGAPATLAARAMAAAGEPWAQEIALGVRQAVTPAQRAAALARVSRAEQRAGQTPRERLLAVGLAGLRVELVAEGSAARVAGRLPAALGRALLA
jgi:hypothetical protein